MSLCLIIKLNFIVFLDLKRKKNNQKFDSIKHLSLTIRQKTARLLHRKKCVILKLTKYN